MGRTTIKSACIQVLKEGGKEMHVQDITKKVKQIVPIRSKTPTKSVNSVMQKTDEIRRVGPGTFKYVGK